MIDFLNETDNNEIDSILGELTLIAKDVTDKEIELIFVDDEQMQEINKTNVIKRKQLGNEYYSFISNGYLSSTKCLAPLLLNTLE